MREDWAKTKIIYVYICKRIFLNLYENIFKKCLLKSEEDAHWQEWNAVAFALPWFI